MNTRAAGRGTTTAGIAATTDAVTTVAAAGERGRQGTTRGVIYQPGSTLTKFGTFPENRTTSVSRSLTGSSTVPFHRGGRCFVRLPVSRSLTGSSTVPVHRKGGSRQRMSGPSTMSHPAMWTCPACGRPLTVALNPEGGEAGAHRPLEISRASAAAHACAPAARFPQFHNASSSSITGYEPASCQPWQPPVSAGAEDDEGVISQSEYTLTKPSSCPNHRDHVKRHRHRPDAEFAAQFGHQRVAVGHRGLSQPHLGFRQRELPAALAVRSAPARTRPALRRCRTRRRPAAVVVSICAPWPASTRRPMPRADRSCTVLTGRRRRGPRPGDGSRYSLLQAADGERPTRLGWQVMMMWFSALSRGVRGAPQGLGPKKRRRSGSSAASVEAPQGVCRASGRGTTGQITIRSISSTVTVSAVRS